MSRWLAFRVELGWVVFVAGVGFTLIISFATVGYRSLRAAVANPVDALWRRLKLFIPLRIIKV